MSGLLGDAAVLILDVDGALDGIDCREGLAGNLVSVCPGSRYASASARLDVLTLVVIRGLLLHNRRSHRMADYQAPRPSTLDPNPWPHCRATNMLSWIVARI